MPLDRSLRARELLALFALACLATPLCAGNVLRVGTGQPFATVQDAVNAAQSGDLVLVDPGTYPPFQVGSTGLGPKNFSIAASGASFSITPVPGSPEILIENIPVGRTVTLSGAQIAYDDPAAPAIVVRNCSGAVRLSDIDVVQSSFLPGATVTAAVVVENTKTLWLSDSSIWGNAQVGDTLNTLCVGGICNDGISGLQLTDSSGAIQNSRVRGYENSSSSSVTGYGGDGVRLIGQCSVWFLENAVGGKYASRFRGGAGIFGGHAIHQVRTPTAPNLNRSCGGLTSPSWEGGARLVAGQGARGGFYGFNNTNGSVSAGGGPVAFLTPVQCGLGESNETEVQASFVPIGSDLVVQVWTRKARQYLLLVSETTRYGTHAGLDGKALLRSEHPQLTASGATLAQTTRLVTFPVPLSTSLVGMQVTVQAATGPVGSPLDALTLPSFAVIGP